MTFSDRILNNQKCEKCMYNLSEKDFFIESGYNDKCPHGILQHIKAKYNCPKCMHYISWNSWRANPEEICITCIYNKNIYDQKEISKPCPDSLNYQLRFHVETRACSGHWMSECGCDATCEDCKKEECCCYGINHCCCIIDKNEENRNISIKFHCELL